MRNVDQDFDLIKFMNLKFQTYGSKRYQYSTAREC